jgi:predicted Rossmann-fold nucleotide-binding protein
LTGAYGGTAEGVSFGASRVPSSHIEGISCPSAYPARVSTQYLTVETTASDRFEREAGLVKHADAFIVLPGQLGTLAHLTQVWNVSVGETAQSKPPLCILAWRSPWEGVLTSIAGALKLPAAMVHAVTFVDSVDQAMEELEKMRQHKRNSKVGVHGAAASSSSSSSSSSAAAPTAAAP